MDKEDIPSAFKGLNSVLKNLSDLELEKISESASNQNGWFTESNVRMAFEGIIKLTDPDNLDRWLENYSNYPSKNQRNIGIVMAGNIPMVGFHDLLCVLVSGHRAIIKLSHKDEFLMNYIIEELIELVPEIKNRIKIVERLKDFDAVIATGSDNSSRYFEYYFGKYPCIIRKNRNSVSVLYENTTDENLTALGKDVFSYFGLGCRNVSKLYLERGFDIERLAKCWQTDYEDAMNHHKYANNYEYRRSIYLVNQDHHLDFGFVILKEGKDIATPISVLHYEYFKTEDILIEELNQNKDKIQCLVCEKNFIDLPTVPFGTTQEPEISDYADNIDTMKFLLDL